MRCTRSPSVPGGSTVRPVLLSVIALTAAALGTGCARSKSSQARQRPAPLVAIAPALARDVPVEVRAPVDLRPLAQADVGSKTLGYLDAVLVDRGDRVHKGQILALVRPSDLPDQLAAARSHLAQAQSSVALARSSYDRAKALAPAGVVSQQELQAAETQLATSEAAAQASQAQIAALAVRLGETKIVSPLTGLVSQRRLDPGALVGPPGGGAIVTVVRIDVLRVFISVNERDLQGVAVGQEAHVELDALPGRRFTGKVVRLAPALDPTTRTLDAEVHLPNPSGELRAGMYGRGAIVLAVHPGATVVPISAVVFGDGRPYLFVVSGEVAHRRPVEIGVDGGEWLEVKSGVRAGDEVVVAGAEALADGVRVRVSRGTDPFSGGPMRPPAATAHDGGTPPATAPPRAGR